MHWLLHRLIKTEKIILNMVRLKSSSGRGQVLSSVSSTHKDARFDSHCLRTFSRLPGILILSVSEKRWLNEREKAFAVLPMRAIPAQGTIMSEIPEITVSFCNFLILQGTKLSFLIN